MKFTLSQTQKPHTVHKTSDTGQKTHPFPETSIWLEFSFFFLVRNDAWQHRRIVLFQQNPLQHPLQHNISVGVCQITHVSCLWNINLPFHYHFLKPETFAIVMNELVNIAWLDKSFLSFHRKMALFITYVVVPLIFKFCVFCNASVLARPSPSPH